MKAVNLSKLYESMPPNELAVMTFESLVKGDNIAAKNIAMAVPQYTYTSADKDYVGRLNRIFDVAALWSIEYWKCYAKMVASIGLAIQRKQNDPSAHIGSTDDLELVWEGRLCALGQILLSLNDSHNIDIEAMLKFSDVQTIYGFEMAPKELSKDALEYYQNYRIYFESLIDESDLPEDVEHYFFSDFSVKI